jgi:hypothetical protein
MKPRELTAKQILGIVRESGSDARIDSSSSMTDTSALIDREAAETERGSVRLLVAPVALLINCCHQWPAKSVVRRRTCPFSLQNLC